MKAIIETQGQQVMIREGDILFVNHDAGPRTVRRRKSGVLYVEGAFARAILLENKRGKQICIFKKSIARVTSVAAGIARSFRSSKSNQFRLDIWGKFEKRHIKKDKERSGMVAIALVNV
jgi:ribosomal protein L21